MRINDAMNLLGLSGTVTQQEIKKAYKKASIKYHPDKNPAGSEMMKAINEAYETLKKYEKDISFDESDNQTAYDYSENLSDFLKSIIDLIGLEIEVCGNWVWITGDTRTHKDLLKELGCKWAKKKKAWYFRPEEWKSSARRTFSMDEIRDKHGSSKVKGNPGKYVLAS